jgi:hypothetical protein
LWLKADDGVVVSGTDVIKWLDKSPSDIVAAAEEAPYPQFQALAINGQPAITFSGNFMYATANSIGQGVDLFSGASPRTMWVVYYTDSTSLPMAICGESNETPASGSMFVMKSQIEAEGGNPLMDFKTTYLASSIAYANNTWTIAMADYDGTTAKLYAYNVLKGSGAKTLNTTSRGNGGLFVIGGQFVAGDNQPFGGKIAEIICYNRVLTTDERQQVETYLENKYLLPQITGLSLWLKADSGITLSGTEVTAWADQSGNGKNFSSQINPTFASNAKNGKPALTFSGSRMNGPGVFSGSSARTMFVVYYTDNTGGVSNTICGQNNLNNLGTGTFFMMQARNDGLNSSPYLAGYNADVSGPAYQNNVWKIAVADYDGTTANLYSNGTLAGSETLSLNTYNVGNCFNIGCFYDAEEEGYIEFFYGKIAEIITYNRKLTTNERQRIEAYLNTKYAIY